MPLLMLYVFDRYGMFAIAWAYSKRLGGRGGREGASILLSFQIIWICLRK